MDLPDLLAWPSRTDIPGMLFRRLISKHALVGLDAMTRAEQVLWLVFELCGEVAAGGLDQFFSNSSGDQAALVPAALRELGHPALADAFARTLGHFEVDADRQARHAALSVLKAPARAELAAVEKQVDAEAEVLLLNLAAWIGAHQAEFSLANAGLAAFRPVEIPAELPLEEVFAEGVPNDAAIPALYIRWAGRTTPLSAVERELQWAIHAFGEVSDEGPVSYFFCTRGRDARRARQALEAAGAEAAARVLDQALALFPWTEEVEPRRAALAVLPVDTRAALGKLQWEMDALREPTLEALVAHARKHRASLQ